MVKKIAKKIKEGNERDARVGLLEDLFYDFNRTRGEVYKMNFIRGIFFGLGSVLGGTILIALIVWILSWFVDLPGIGGSLEQIQKSLEESKK